MSLQIVQRFAYAVLTATVLCASSNAAPKNAAPMPRIIPLLTNATFSAHSADSGWSAAIKSIDGGTVYIVSPGSGVSYRKGHHVEGLEIALRHPHDKTDSQNLLAAIRNWHGAPPFLFDATDLKSGAGHSTYGENRAISIDNLGLVVRITVLKSEVSQTSAFPNGGYQIDALELRIIVDNADEK